VIVFLYMWGTRTTTTPPPGCNACAKRAPPSPLE
jgi:hypothetical protein